jgi:3-phytase
MQAGRRLVSMVSAVALGVATLGLAQCARAATPTVVASDGETVPVGHSGDSADDPAIWVNPVDPARSLLIGNDKLGALETYDLNGALVQRITDNVSFWGNVDVRSGVTIAGRTRDLVGVIHRGIQIYAVDAGTRQLTLTNEGTAIGSAAEGFCLYTSPTSGTSYAFGITLPGQLRQWELGDVDDDGLIDATMVREFAVGSEAEGCVADDETGALFVSEEDVALWRYDAEPGGGTARTAVDRIGDVLVSDIEGLTLVSQPGGGGYLLASVQNVADPDNSYFAVYRRTGGHEFVSTFRIGNGTTSDDCDRTDGITAYAGDLGPRFPQGMFVCQDNNNDAPGVGNQDFKMVRLDKVVDLTPGSTNAPPVAAATVRCTGLSCTFDGSGSRDPEGSALRYSWDFGDGSAGSGLTAGHSYAAGSYTATLTVTDPAGAFDTAALAVRVPASSPISPVGAVAVNANTRTFRVTTPAVAAGDAMILTFSAASASVSVTGPAGWTQVGRVVDQDLATTVWQRAATATDAGSSVTVTAGSLVKGALSLAAYRGADPAGPVVGYATRVQTATSANLATAGIATVPDGAWQLSYWATRSSSITGITAPSSQTVRVATAGTGGGRITSTLADGSAPVAAPAPSLTAVASAATDKATMVTILLAPRINQRPTAGFASSCVGLTCTWDFGDDSGIATGIGPRYSFAAAGSYPVTLTVTDSLGAADSLTLAVAVG